MSNRIFINYRRRDSSGSAGRLNDRLVEHFGKTNVFMDVNTIMPGKNFLEEIKTAIYIADFFLVVIGPSWVSMRDKSGNPRLHDPNDYVRLEIETAFEQNITVIPVLVDGSNMPAPSDLPETLKRLSYLNAIEISHSRFSLDVDRLISSMEAETSFPEDSINKRDMKIKGYTEIRSLCKAIKYLLLENHQVWAIYGPDSDSAKMNPTSNIVEIWSRRKLDTIVPNNRRIINLIEDNKDLFSLSEYEICRRFIEHAEGFEISCYQPKDSIPRFPVEFQEVIDRHVERK